MRVSRRLRREVTDYVSRHALAFTVPELQAVPGSDRTRHDVVLALGYRL